MSVRVKTVSDECRTVNAALAALGKSPLPPPQITDRVASWRRVALLTLGAPVNGCEPGRSDVLQACGQLYKTATRDASGRSITKFHGDATTCWQPFQSPARKLTGINTKGKP